MDAMTADEFAARVRAIKPAIAARAAECESLRRMPDETWKELAEAGVWLALKPRAFGGLELDVLALYRAQMDIAEVCPSTAWVMGVIGVHDWMLGRFPEQAQQEVWGDGRDAQISSALAGTGQVERAPGGFRVSGRFPYSSGCHHCKWVVLGGAVRDPDRIVTLALLLPRADYEIDDVWHVAGLAGTGSNDVVVKDVFVPEHRTSKYNDIQQSHPRPLYRLPFGGVFNGGIAAPAIGAAQGMIELFRRSVRERASAYAGARAVEDPFAQHALARARGAVDGVRLRFERSWRDAIDLAARGETLPIELRRQLRFDANQAVETSIAAVDWLFALSGARANFLSNPMQRMFRDAHAMRGHAMNSHDKVTRMYGRYDLVPDAPPLEPIDKMV